MIKNGQKYLVTTSEWFYGRDGMQYRAAWGICEAVSAKQELGFEPRHGTNWFVRVGDGDKALIIAGCQVHYAIQLDEAPFILPGYYKDEKSGLEIKNNPIYIPGHEVDHSQHVEKVSLLTVIAEQQDQLQQKDERLKEATSLVVDLHDEYYISGDDLDLRVWLFLDKLNAGKEAGKDEK